MSEVVVETQGQLLAVLDQISDEDHQADRSAPHAIAAHASSPPMADTMCPACGEQSSVTFTREEERFPYGIAPHTVELAAMVDKGRCAACTFEFTDWRAEEARDRAVQIYLAARKELPRCRLW